MKKLTNAEQLAFPCPVCMAVVGQKCRNYLGKGKAPCPERGVEQKPKREPVKDQQPTLFRDLE